MRLELLSERLFYGAEGDKRPRAEPLKRQGKPEAGPKPSEPTPPPPDKPD